VKEDGGKKVDGGSDLQNSRGKAIVSAFPPFDILQGIIFALHRFWSCRKFVAVQMKTKPDDDALGEQKQRALLSHRSADRRSQPMTRAARW
jgi:hypothetical protein